MCTHNSPKNMGHKWTFKDESLFRSGKCEAPSYYGKERGEWTTDDEMRFLGETSDKHESDTSFDTNDHEMDYSWSAECNSVSRSQLRNRYDNTVRYPEGRSCEERMYEHNLAIGLDEVTSRHRARVFTGSSDDSEPDDVKRRAGVSCDDETAARNARMKEREEEEEKKKQQWVRDVEASREYVRHGRVMRRRRLERRREKIMVKKVVAAVVVAVVEAAAREAEMDKLMRGVPDARAQSQAVV